MSHIPAGQGGQQPDERLLDLFWNRAELKKTLARLRAERDEFRDRVRQQEGEILRGKQRLEQLEGLLADPVLAANAAVHYQLRSMWSLCRRRIVRLVRERTEAELQEAAQAGAQEFERRRAETLADLDSRIAIAGQRVRQTRQALRDEQRRGRGLRRLFHPRQARAEIEALQTVLEVALAQQKRLESVRSVKVAEAVPDSARLGIAGCRRVNLMAVALAEELYLHFSEEGIARLARDAASRFPADAHYGNAADCRRISRTATRLVQDLEGSEDLAARVMRRAGFLATVARYRLETDAVPIAATCSSDGLSVPKALAADVDVSVNVLADDYWDIYSALLN